MLHEVRTGDIIRAAFEVMNFLGHGLLEKPYENALCVEFAIMNIPFEQQPRYEVEYKQCKVGEYMPDLMVDGCIIVDLKVIEKIGSSEIGQMLNYLKITGCPVGLIINFKHSRLEWKRVLNDSSK